MKQKVSSIVLENDELMQLEEVKKELKKLGFSLLTILKALKDGIRVIDPEDSSVIDDYIVFIAKFADGWGIRTLNNFEFLFNEYGKNWALSCYELWEKGRGVWPSTEEVEEDE